jgi:Mn2+/Fe2+ NRAMP family transporter
MNFLERFFRSIFRFFFIAIPVVIWQDVFVAAFTSVAHSVRNLIRRNALWIIGGGVVFLLVVTKQYQILDTFFTYAIAIVIIAFGFRIIVKGLPKTKKKRR